MFLKSIRLKFHILLKRIEPIFIGRVKYFFIISYVYDLNIQTFHFKKVYK